MGVWVCMKNGVNKDRQGKQQLDKDKDKDKDMSRTRTTAALYIHRIVPVQLWCGAPHSSAIALQ